ncbi:YolD-like family protein [Paenibacillus sp. Marseille-Q4541]|uniref:YolD-like family protein n=1 Tax=Paenibacillus sp. Marseille-Q4541 TaxID=2831522 RepID=UPI001BA7CB9E|nr:YolD-like family protein [Paenibacillus sp. Marseille-Q4541]
MSKKLVGNGIFEGSRMIIPEHRTAWLMQEESKKIRTKPTLDDQEIQQIEHTIVYSYNKRVNISLVLFDPIEDKEVEGVVIGINTYRREIKFSSSEDDWEWIKIKNIIYASSNR